MVIAAKSVLKLMIELIEDFVEDHSGNSLPGLDIAHAFAAHPSLAGQPGDGPPKPQAKFLGVS
jgi:hypothetical protein